MNPKKQNKIIIISLFTLLIAGLVIRFLTPTILPPQKLAVIATKPPPNTNHNPFLPLEITFNQTFEVNSLQYTLTPPTNIVPSIDSTTNTLILTPNPSFESESQYTLTINLDPSFTLSFATQQIESNTPGWNEQFEAANQTYLQEHGTQDKALMELRQKTPLVTTNFTIDFEYKTNTYIITLTKQPYSQTQQEAVDWLYQKGITDLSTVRIKWLQQ